MKYFPIIAALGFLLVLAACASDPAAPSPEAAQAAFAPAETTPEAVSTPVPVPVTVTEAPPEETALPAETALPTEAPPPEDTAPPEASPIPEDLPDPLQGAVEACATAEKTEQIVLAVDHELTFWEKAEDGSWRLRMDVCCGYGGNGLVEADSRIMGTRTTPIGSFPLTLAFGLGPDPGTGMTYRQIMETSYWSSEDDDTYNTWVESDTPVSGEHLIDYYQYKYAVNIGFNLDPPDHNRGCAIFLHCKSTGSWNTAGCVSLTEENMLELLLSLRDGAYMIIVKDIESISVY